VGIQADGFENEDKMSLHLVNIVKARLGITAITHLHIQFDNYEGSRVLMVRCRRAPAPIFVKDGETEKFYVRTGPSSTELSPSQTQEFIKNRFAVATR
jgi:predicted HTH transcriptional regulator